MLEKTINDGSKATAKICSLWAESPEIYFLKTFTSIRISFVGTKLKIVISRLNVDRGTFFKVVRKD